MRHGPELEDAMTGRQIKLVFVGVPPSMNQFNGRTNVQVYRAVKADWTDRVTWQARARRPKRPFERAEVLIEYQFQDNRRRDPDNYYVQILHQLLATGWDFAVLNCRFKRFYRDGSRAETRCYRFERTDLLDDLNYLLQAEIAFWGYVQSDTLPDLILPSI